MAKKKKKDDEDLLQEEEVVEEVVDDALVEDDAVVEEAVEEVAAVDAAEEEIDAPLDSFEDVEPVASDDLEPMNPLDSMEIADEDLAAVTGDLDDVAVPPDTESPDEVEEEEAPRPAVHWAVYVLAGLNIVAALAFPYFLIQDFDKRQEYSYAVFRTELAMLGLPTEEEEEFPTAARATLPNARVSAEAIKKVMTDRGVNVPDPVHALDEPIAMRVVPGQLDKDILKDHFGEHYLEANGQLIRTLEDEVRRIEKSLPETIKKAAEDSYPLIQGDDAKRARAEKMLLPLAMDGPQAKKLDARIKAAQGKDLQNLYLEAAQRRMAFDFLLPLEMFRPGDTRTSFLEKFGDLEALPLEKVLQRVTDRVKSTVQAKHDPALHYGDGWSEKERDTIEKRLTVAFTLLSLAHVKGPMGDPLFPKLLERLPLVVGQYDFAAACQLFPARVRAMNERVLANLQMDREGFEVLDKDGTSLRRTWGFPDRYEQDLQEIRYTQQDIKKAALRLQDLQQQKKRTQQLVDERTKQQADVMARIAEARKRTAKDNDELRLFQNELFEYQLQLATSQEELGRLNERIRQESSRKGGR